MTTKTKIEEIWNILRLERTPAQRRIDASHPLDLYADFEQPDRPGLVLFSPARPPDAPSLKAIGTELRQRNDGVWSLRIFLQEPRLLSVFGELCRDIIDSTRSGVEPERAGAVVLSRIQRWRSLMEAEPRGWSNAEIRGLIGEMLVLETRLLPALGPDAALRAWTGPLGTPQDFQLPDGLKLEVKAIGRDADNVLINGLGQLDGGGDQLQLAVVRLENTGPSAPLAITLSSMIARLRSNLTDTPEALRNFELLLGFLGWTDDRDSGAVVVRLDRIEYHDVTESFPRLTHGTVPRGVLDATYTIALPQAEAAP